MSQESFSPVPLNSDTVRDHVVVRGEAVEHDSEAKGFMESTLRSQNEASTEARSVRRKRETVESIEPEHVHLEGRTATVAEMLAARELVHHESYQAHTEEEREALVEDLLDRLMRRDDPETEFYKTHRAMLRGFLLQSDKKFQATHRRYEVHQARRDEVKLKRPKLEKSDKGSLSIFSSVSERFGADKTAQEHARSSTAQLRRGLKKMDKQFNGLLGAVAETETKPEYLETKHVEFVDHMYAQDHNVNGKTRRSIEREAVRKLISAKDLADRKSLEGAERKAYEDQLVDTFHQYAKLDDDERAEFHEILSSRYRVAKELSQREAAEAQQHPRQSLRGILGAMALKIAQNSHRVRSEHASTEDERLELSSDAPHKKSRSRGAKEKAVSVNEAVNRSYHKIRANQAAKRQREQERLAGLSADERAAQREKKRDRLVVIGTLVGGAAIFAASLYYMKYGLDNPFNGVGSDRLRADGDTDTGQTGGLADLLNVPELDDTPPGDLPGTELDPNDGGDSPRAELFDGRGGSRNLSTQNVESLKDFLSDYKVKENDDRGVWGISEKYLESKGVKNPSVFETDAVKDYILGHSSLTNSSIIHPGDTIRLK